MKSTHYSFWSFVASPIFFAFCVSTPPPANATLKVELKQLIERGEDVIWLRVDQIQGRGTTRVATLVFEGSNLGVPNVKSAIGRYEMGCQRRRIRRLYMRYYAGAALSGALLKSEESEKNSREVEGESLEETIWNYICFRVAPTAN